LDAKQVRTTIESGIQTLEKYKNSVNDLRLSSRQIKSIDKHISKLKS
jgi:hypothetical protein